MKSKSARFAIFAASTLAITFVHATDYDWLGVTGASTDTAAFGWGTTTNWTPNGTPGSVDSIVASRDLIPSTTGPTVNNTLTARYAVTPELGTTVRQITSITFDDSDLTTNNTVTFAPGITGAQLEFNTTTPVISTNITNVTSSAARLVVQNPLFSQPSTTFTKGGTGSVELDFFVPGGVTAFNNNVASLACSSSGDLRISNAATASTLNLPDIDFSTNNNRLMLTGGSPQVVGSGVDINTGTNELAIGGGANVSFNTGSTLTGTGGASGLNLAPGNSTYQYMNGNATLNWNGATGSGGRIRLGDGLQQSSTSTVNFNMQLGSFEITESAANSIVGNCATDGRIQNLNLTVSGGSLSFTSVITGDFHFGQSQRNNATIPGTLSTVNSILTVSGTGLLDLGTGTRLALGRRNATNTIININADLKLDGGELKTAREIARSTIGTGAGTTVARVFLNGGKLTNTAALGNLFTTFGTGTGLAADGVFISSGGAIINTDFLSTSTTTISTNLQENPSSTGGGLTKQGPATLYLTGTASTFTGPMLLQAGTLAFNNSGAFGTGSASITQSAGTSIRLNGSATTIRQIVTAGHNANTYNSNAAYNVILQGGITKDPGYTPGASDVYGLESVGTTTIDTTAVNIPALQINKGQVGTLNLNVAGNAYKRLWIYTGTVKTGVAGALDPLAQIDLRTTASVLDLNGFSQSAASLTGSSASGLGSSITSANAATLTISPASGTSTYAGTISGDVGVTKSGAGTQVLSGPNTYTGETIVSGGTLGLPTDDTLADGAAVRIAASGATLNLTYAGNDVVQSFYIGGVQQASGLWGRTGSIAALGAAHESPLITGDGLLSVTTGAVSGNYFTWAATNLVTGGPNGDSDNDGISNVVEYALNLNFAGSDGSPGTLSGSLLSFNKRLEAYNNGDVTYVIEESSDLGITDPWSPVTPDANNSSVISYTIPSGPGDNFARLKTVIVTP